MTDEINKYAQYFTEQAKHTKLFRNVGEDHNLHEVDVSSGRKMPKTNVQQIVPGATPAVGPGTNVKQVVPGATHAPSPNAAAPKGDFKFNSTGGKVSANELGAWRKHVGNNNATLGQYMNARDNKTAIAGGKNDPTVIQKNLTKGQAYDPGKVIDKSKTAPMPQTRPTNQASSATNVKQVVPGATPAVGPGTNVKQVVPGATPAVGPGPSATTPTGSPISSNNRNAISSNNGNPNSKPVLPTPPATKAIDTNIIPDTFNSIEKQDKRPDLQDLKKKLMDKAASMRG